MSKKLKDREVGTSLLVNTLQKKGIKLVAVDFDETFITFHTGGIWKDSVDKLIAKTRPCMRDLIEMCLDKRINVCFVTFFSQPWVIREMLQKLYRRDAEKILVQANDAAFCEKHKWDFPGKEAHIASIVTELYNKEHLKIRPEEIILFDDNRDNTAMAIKFSHMAFLVQEDTTERSFEEFARNLDSKKLGGSVKFS